MVRVNVDIDYNKINKIIEGKTDINDKVINAYSYIALNTINKARDETKIIAYPKVYPHSKSGYYDITGNLRSSIGFVIADKSNVKEENFEKTNDGDDGYNKGTKLAREKAKSTKDIILVMVAGMEYAKELESKRYNVLTKFLPTKKEIKNKIDLFIKL